MKIVVDTNIVFSALLKPTNNIGNILLSTKGIEFYSCDFLKIEIKKHWSKLLSISKIDENEMELIYDLIKSKINFINIKIIPEDVVSYAKDVTANIDENDVEFVSLAKYLNAQLWTGDKILYTGLLKKNFKNIINTTELIIKLKPI